MILGLLPNFGCVVCHTKVVSELRFVGYYGKFMKPIWICKRCDKV